MRVVIIGTQWGDEGKGKIVDILSERSDWVIRFQGGNNAGHTVVVGDQSFALHLIPSGILYPDKICIIAQGVVVDPEVCLREIEGFKSRGYLKDDGQLRVSDAAHVILPYHKRIDVARERALGEGKLGTTGRGVGPAYEDKVVRRGIRLGDLVDKQRLAHKLSPLLEEKNHYLKTFLKEEGFDLNQMVETYHEYGKRLEKYFTDTSQLIQQGIVSNKKMLFEGAQGTLLDIDHGSYPFVTSCHTVAGSVCTGAGIAPQTVNDIIGVTKGYATRVGTGPFPTELKDQIGEELQRRGHEFGTTTGRRRRCGWLDLVGLRYAVAVNGLTSLAMTKLDVLSGIGPLRICVAYRYKGERLTQFPNSAEVLSECTPEYREFPGWKEDITSAKRLADLPSQLRKYIEFIETEMGIPADIISVGPKRSETIITPRSRF